MNQTAALYVVRNTKPDNCNAYAPLYLTPTGTLTWDFVAAKPFNSRSEAQHVAAVMSAKSACFTFECTHVAVIKRVSAC